MEHKNAEQHRDERVDEVAEGRLDDVSAHRRVDVNEPVDDNKNAGHTHHQGGAAIAEDRGEALPPAGDGQKDRAENQGEQDAPAHDLDCAGGGEEKEKRGQQAPEAVGADPEEDASAVRRADGGGLWHIGQPNGAQDSTKPGGSTTGLCVRKSCFRRYCE